MKITIGKAVYNLENEDKVNRAINGSIHGQGQSVGGVGDNASQEEIIAEYDRIGGLITLEKKSGKGVNKSYKVKTGSFYDFPKRTVRKSPEVVLSLRGIDGEEVEISQDEEIPVEVQAAESKADKKKGKKASKEELPADETEE